MHRAVSLSFSVLVSLPLERELPVLGTVVFVYCVQAHVCICVEARHQLQVLLLRSCFLWFLRQGFSLTLDFADSARLCLPRAGIMGTHLGLMWVGVEGRTQVFMLVWPASCQLSHLLSSSCLVLFLNMTNLLFVHLLHLKCSSTTFLA